MLLKSLVIGLTVLVGSFVFAAPEKTPVVFTQVAKTTEIFDQFTYPARIDSSVNSKLLAESDGVVTSVLAPIGSRVARGGGVVVIQNMEPGYSFAPMRVRSPVSGVVSGVRVSVGSQVVKGQELATIIDPKSLRVIVEVAAGDVAYLSSGMKGELHIGGREKPVSVQVLGISPLVDPATGTSTCELKIVDKSAVVPPGTLGQVRFKANSRRGIVLPDNAVVYKGDATNVRVVRDGKAKLLAVKLGLKRQGKFEVLDGLKEGDEIIERTSTFVADGDAVRVQAKESEKKAEKN